MAILRLDQWQSLSASLTSNGKTYKRVLVYANGLEVRCASSPLSERGISLLLTLGGNIPDGSYVDSSGA